MACLIDRLDHLVLTTADEAASLAAAVRDAISRSFEVAGTVVQVGMLPGGGSMVRLARQIPYAHAMKFMLTGDPIDAQTALAWGLVSEVVPGGELLARAEALAERIVANAPLAVQAIKRTALQSHPLFTGE